MLLYYITDRGKFAGTETVRRTKLLQKIGEAARAGVDFIQLREKDLTTRELERLTREAVEIVHASSETTRLLINSRTDVSLAAGADGVHLRSADISPENVRDIWEKAGSGRKPVVGVSCHTEREVAHAAQSGADFAVFGPIFEKRGSSDKPTGIDRLRSVCQYKIPVVALGGVTEDDASVCAQAGAAGIAGIRLFQNSDLGQWVAVVRALKPGQPIRD